jgi:large subunit ribosomal protein L21
MYAILEIGGKQYKIEEGNEISIERLPFKIGDEVKFGNVLMIVDNEKIIYGSPYIENAYVTCKILDEYKDKKIKVFKYKSKVNYRRKRGHRQILMKVKIEKINLS